MQDRPVLLVSDRPDRAGRLARGITLIMPCRVVTPDMRLPTTQPLAWVVDLALDRVADTAWFEELAARVSGGAACVVLSRESGSLDKAALARLGAPVIVAARLHATGVISTLVRAIDQARARRPATPVERQCGIATNLVGSLFAAAAAGAPPDPVQAEESTEIVLEAISDIGIRAWLDLVWRHDITVYQHSLSVAGCAAAFAFELGFSRADRHRLAKAALLHDVGKSRTPLAILNKPAALTPEETAIMRAHAPVGADLLAATRRYEQDVIDVTRSHHERIDGSGYPDGLVGSAIGDLVRLVSICDVYSALTERRVYRTPLSGREAREVMEGMTGQLDADLLRAYWPVITRCDPVA